MENPGITATLKAGKDFDAPWVVLHAANPQQLNDQLDSLTPELLQKVTATAQHLISANNLAAGGVGAGAPAATPIQSAPSYQQAPPAQAPAQQQSGEVCDTCGQGLIPSTTRTGKDQLKCPLYRYDSSTRSGNGHKLVWL